MDWILPLITAGAALGGAAIGGCYALASQRIAQRNENLRHARRIAYETAVKEWEGARYWAIRQYDVDYTGPKIKGPLPSLDDFIIHHLSLTDALDKIDPLTASAESLDTLSARLWQREHDLFTRQHARQKSQE